MSPPSSHRFYGGDRAGAHLLTLAPHSSAGVRGLTTDREKVYEAARIGRETVHGVLALPAAA